MSNGSTSSSRSGWPSTSIRRPWTRRSKGSRRARSDQTWPLRRANYLRWLHDDPDAFVLIAETKDDEPIAYALVSIHAADDTHVTGDRIAELQTLSVLPSHRNAGLGTRMMESVFSELRSLGIHELVITMIATNEPARRFYERFGFRPWLTVALGKVPDAK